MNNHIQNMSIICGFAQYIEHLFKQFANTININTATLLTPTKTNNIKESKQVRVFTINSFAHLSCPY